MAPKIVCLLLVLSLAAVWGSPEPGPCQRGLSVCKNGGYTSFATDSQGVLHCCPQGYLLTFGVGQCICQPLESSVKSLYVWEALKPTLMLRRAQLMKLLMLQKKRQSSSQVLRILNAVGGGGGGGYGNE